MRINRVTYRKLKTLLKVNGNLKWASLIQMVSFRDYFCNSWGRFFSRWMLQTLKLTTIKQWSSLLLRFFNHEISLQLSNNTQEQHEPHYWLYWTKMGFFSRLLLQSQKGNGGASRGVMIPYQSLLIIKTNFTWKSISLLPSMWKTELNNCVFKPSFDFNRWWSPVRELSGDNLRMFQLEPVKMIFYWRSITFVPFGWRWHPTEEVQPW